MVDMVILAARWQLVSTSNIGRVVDKCHNVFDQVELTRGSLLTKPLKNKLKKDFGY